MKRYALWAFLMAAFVFLNGSSALLNEQNSKQLSDQADQDGQTFDALPQTFTGSGRYHKVIIGQNDEAAYALLKSQGAIVAEINYGSFKLIRIDENAVGGRDGLNNLSISVRDDQNLIALNGYILDTTDPDATYRRIPADLRRADMYNAMARGMQPPSGLYIVQFAGPIRDEWLDALKERGIEIVSFMPSNAYIVRAENPQIAGELPLMLRQNEFVQFVGDYEPAFRLAPELREMRKMPAGTGIDVTVQVIDGPSAENTIAALKAISFEFVQTYQVLNYHNVQIKVDAARLVDIARIDNVFAVEERFPRSKLDEAQGQIVAGNISGNLAGAPGYLAWLAGKGFNSNSTQFESFSVNVVDDAYLLTGVAQHPDLPASRVTFQNNATSMTGAQGGHGFLNSHIVGGFNSQTGTAFEDARGHNYGLGIAPFARVGITAIFGSGAATPTGWENTAYGNGARVSSNSWGFTGTAARRYDVNAQEFDRIVRDAQSGVAGLQQLTVVFAAGNSGSSTNTVSSPATAKNVICVGAGENDRQTGSDGCAVGNTGADSINDVINFSSRGPVNSAGGDGRIKPDIMAPGTHIEAGIPQGTSYDGSSVCNKFFPAGSTLYGWSSGTSHSCPAVAGGAALVYQDFLNKGLPAPTPAMVKAFLMNSATRMTGVGANDTLPSNNQGMGRMNLGQAFDGAQRVLVDQTQTLGATGETYQTTGTIVDTTKPFRVTLAWSDAPGPTTGAPYINNLNLQVTVNGTTYLGNVFSAGNSITGGTADVRNNVESVFLPAGTSGNFTVTVTAANIAGDGVPGNADTTDQDFALVAYNATSGAAPSPTIGVSPTSFSFSAVAGGANPANQTLNISNTGGGTLSYTVSDNATWLTLSPLSGTAPSAVTLSVNITGLAAGTYPGTVTVTATGATNTPVSVPVTLTVTAAPTPPTIGVSPTSFSFSAVAGGANPANQALNISNTGGSTLNYTVSDNATWLTLSPLSGTAPSAVTLSVNITGLAAGTYPGTVTVTATGATNTPVSVPVTLTVTAAPTPPTIGLSPTSFSFTATAGGANPANQALNISNTGGGTLSYTVSDNATWLTLSPLSGTAPSVVTLSVNITGLAAGTYSGTVTVNATGATNTPRTVPVTLTVNAATGAELIVNSGFETSTTSPSPWVRTGTGGLASNLNGTGSFPNSGNNYIFLCNANSATGSLYQQISIPSTATGTLTFSLNISSSETTTITQFDRLFIEVRNTSGTLLATLGTFSNLNKAAAGVYSLKSFSLANFKGQTVRVQFRATTDSSLTSVFRIDDVSVK